MKHQGIGLKRTMLCPSDGDERTLPISSKKSRFPSLRPHQRLGTFGNRQQRLPCSPLIKSVDSNLDAEFGEDYRRKGLCSKTCVSICTAKMTVLLSRKNKRQEVCQGALYTEEKNETKTKAPNHTRLHLCYYNGPTQGSIEPQGQRHS